MHSNRCATSFFARFYGLFGVNTNRLPDQLQNLPSKISPKPGGKKFRSGTPSIQKTRLPSPLAGDLKVREISDEIRFSGRTCFARPSSNRTDRTDRYCQIRYSKKVS